VWQYSLDLASALNTRDVDVTVAVMGPPPGGDQRDEAATRGVRVIHAGYRLEWMEDPWADVARAGKWLLALERKLEPDVVHLNGYAHGALPWRAPTVVAGHSCVRSWWHAVHGVNAPRKWDRYSLEVARGLRAARVVVAPTAAMLDALDSYYGPLGPACVIPNGRESACAGAGTTHVSAEAPAKEDMVFAAGRLWDPAKNIESLCAVAPDLPWPVLVAGECHAPGASCVIPPHVRYLGRLSADQMQQSYARAAIYALPARYEPFGLTVLEAASAGCALVLGDIRSLRENWDGAAVFVRPDDPRSLAAAIQALIADGAWRRDLARCARTRARQFTVKRMVEGYLRAYEDAIARCTPYRPNALHKRHAGAAKSTSAVAS
jgi:glycogen(starch) synthase